MELIRLSDGIYYSTKDDEYDQPCLYAAVGNRCTLMVDGGVTPQRAREFLALLRRETGRGADFAAVTHWHWDHIFGLAGIDAPVIASANTARHIERMSGYNSWSDEAMAKRIQSGEEIEACALNIKKSYPGDLRGRIEIRQPDIEFTGTMAIDLGGLSCLLTLLPPVHTNDCVAIHVPQRDTLILGDAMYGNSYDRPAHYSAQPVLNLLAYIRGTSASIFLDSHAGLLNTEEFWRSNCMLEAAAQGVLSGICTKDALLDHMARMYGDCLPEDAGETAALFIAGIEYDKLGREAR